MGVGAGLYMYDVVVKKFTFAISSPDEFLFFEGSCAPSNTMSPEPKPTSVPSGILIHPEMGRKLRAAVHLTQCRLGR